MLTIIFVVIFSLINLIIHPPGLLFLLTFFLFLFIDVVLFINAKTLPPENDKQYWY